MNEQQMFHGLEQIKQQLSVVKKDMEKLLFKINTEACRGCDGTKCENCICSESRF